MGDREKLAKMPMLKRSPTKTFLVQRGVGVGFGDIVSKSSVGDM